MGEASSDYSTSSSDISAGEVYKAEYKWLDQKVTTPRDQRHPRDLYSIHIYLPVEPRGALVIRFFCLPLAKKLTGEGTQ